METVFHSKKTFASYLIKRSSSPWREDLSEVFYKENNLSKYFMEKRSFLIGILHTYKSFFCSLKKNPFTQCSSLEEDLSRSSMEQRSFRGFHFSEDLLLVSCRGILYRKGPFPDFLNRGYRTKWRKGHHEAFYGK